MKINKLLSGMVVAGLLTANVVWSAANNDAMTPQQKKQIESIVREYLIQNPEVVVESLQVFQNKQMQEARQTAKKTQDNSVKFANQLFHQSTDPIAGNPSGAVTVVEFFDYQCPHCIEMAKTMDEVIKTDKNLRVVLKEFPIRGPMSEFAARAALASQKQGKYVEFHNALMVSTQQPLTESIIFDIAKSVGLNTDQLKKDMGDKSVDAQIKANYKLAQDLQLMGTPVLFVAKSTISSTSPAEAIIFIPGRVEEPQLIEVINKVNK